MKYLLLAGVVLVIINYLVKNAKSPGIRPILIGFPLILMLLSLLINTAGGYILIIFMELVWWWNTYVKEMNEEYWEKPYLFANYFMILFLVGLLLVGPIIGIYSVPNKIASHHDEGLYFLHLFKTGVITGIFFGTIAGTAAATKKKD